MDARRFPTVARYLERLPHGVHSYPNELSKAALYVQALEAHPIACARGELPDAISALLANPLPVTEWVPSVHFHCVMLAVRDAYFAHVDAYASWLYRRNLELLSRPLYKVLFLVMSPERLVSGVEQRWRAFRRGCSLEVTESRPREVRLRLTYSERLFELNTLRGVGEGLRAAVDAAGARESTVELDQLSEREARYRLRWSSVASALQRVL